MIVVEYIERYYIDRFKCVDTERTIIALSSFIQGGLTYLKIDRFNYKIIETIFIKSLQEVKTVDNINHVTATYSSFN